VGDRIQIGSVTGDVSDLRLFQFSVLEIGQWVHGDQPTGRIVHVPNGRVFSEPQVNYTSEFPFIWNELPVTLTFESNWQLAKALFEEIIGRHGLRESDAVAWLESTSHAITRLAASPAVITSVADNGVVLTLRYLCHPRQRRATAEQIWEDVLRAVGASDDIDFAYPTTRLYNNRREGKPGTGGPAGAGVGE
jgi:small-conductance mechanosensitive channel